jgi:PAS domain S-box-containing protein
MPPQKPAIPTDTPTNAVANAFASKFRLRTALIVPFVLQVITVVGLVSYLYFRNEQKAVEDVATQSRQQIAVRVEQNLRGYLAIPHLVNQNNAIAIDLGQLNLQNLSGLEQFFWRQLQVFDTLTFAGIGFENKDNLGAERVDDGSLVLRVSTKASGYDFGTYSTDQFGNRLQLLHQKPNFDPRTRPWYKAAVAAGKPTWSQIYPNTAGLTSYLGASLPFYNKQGNLQGVLLTNINLSQIGSFLQNLKIGKTGQVFIIERSGLLVATSTGEKPFLTVQKEFGAERVKAIDSSNPLTQATMQYLTKNFTANDSINIQEAKLLEFNFKGQREFLQVLPFRDQFGLDWLIVVVVPESDFTGQIAINTRNTIQLTLVALVVAIALGILTSHYITRPILRVSQASKAIAAGNLDQHVASSHITEIETLTHSFNSMAGQLQASFTALKQSETQNRAIVEALPDLLFHAKGDGTYLADPIGRNRLKALFAGDRPLKGVNISDSLPPQLARQRMQAIQQALQTGELQVYEQQLVINEKIVNEEVRVVRITDDEVLVMVRDITERKRIEDERKQLEIALQESEARFRGVFEQATVGIALVTLAGQFSLINRRFCELLGYPESELRQLTNLDVTHPDDQVTSIVEIRRLLTGETASFSVDKRYIRKDGQIQWGNLTCSPIYNPQGELQYLLGVLLDISERKQAEENLRIAEENYRSIFENALEGIFQSTPDGRFISVNPAMARIYGYASPEEMLTSITDIGRQTFVDSAERDELKRLLNEQGQLKGLEYQIYRKDSSIIWIEENTRVVKDAEGNVLYYEGIIQDITDRKRRKEILETMVEERTVELAKANAALKASEAELRGLFAAMDDVIIVYNREGICLKVASTHPNLLLRSSEEMIGRSVYDILPEAQANQRLEAIQQVLETHQTITLEYRLVLGNEFASFGEEIWFSANLSPLSDDTVIMVARDITTRKQVEQALGSSEAELRALFAAMTDIVIVKDIHGRYCKIAPTNPSNLLISAAGLVGLTEHDILPKAQADRFVNHIQQVLKTQQMMSIDYCLTIENREVWFTANVSPLAADTVVWVARDISERKRVEAALQESERKYRTIFENSQVGIGRTRIEDGLFLDANQRLAEMLGFHVAADLIGQESSRDLCMNLDNRHHMIDDLKQEGVRDYEIHLRRLDGSMFWGLLSVQFNVEESSTEFFITDISDRKQAEAALQNSLTQLALANQEIKSLNQRLKSENIRLSAELSVARQLQQMILPKDHEFDQIDDLEIAGFMAPADEVGGDYYDVIPHNGSVKIGIGDVTGHGLESGVLMIMVQTAVRTLLANNETDPNRFLSTINQVIYDNARRMNSGKNLSLALLDYQAGRVKLSGQHEEMLVVRIDGQIERIDTIDLGFFLGLVPDISEFIAQIEVQLHPGDGVVLYTDGITEAQNEAKEYYGLERLCQVVSENWRQSVAEIRQAIVADVQAHIGQQKVYDDITLLVLKQK